MALIVFLSESKYYMYFNVLEIVDSGNEELRDEEIENKIILYNQL